MATASAQGPRGATDFPAGAQQTTSPVESGTQDGRTGLAAERTTWAQTLEPVLSELRAMLQERQPAPVAQAAGATWNAAHQALELQLLDQTFRIPWQTLVAYPVAGDEPCPANLQGLFLYYLCQADGTPVQNRWVAFRELPDGWLYHQAFQGYTGHVLAQRVGNNVAAFQQAATRIGGRRKNLGDAGFAFLGLPRIPLAVVYWLGDDEFPPHAQVLFDGAAGHYLPSDGLAGLGRYLVGRLLKEVP